MKTVSDEEKEGEEVYSLQHWQTDWLTRFKTEYWAWKAADEVDRDLEKLVLNKSASFTAVSSAGLAG